MKPIIDAFTNAILKKRKGEFLLKPTVTSSLTQNFLYSHSTFSQNSTKQSKIKYQKTNSKVKIAEKKAITEELMKLAETGEFIELDPPYQVSASLKLVNTGVVNINPNYHSEHNLFPIGFKTIRTHSSMIYSNAKTEYVCEILDGGDKPIYKVTPLEDENNPIIRDSSTGCWIHVCNRVNEISERKKAKVTISGTERFGLIDPIVVSLLESLPNAYKCTRYNFKSDKKSKISFED